MKRNEINNPIQLTKNKKQKSLKTACLSFLNQEKKFECVDNHLNESSIHNHNPNHHHQEKVVCGTSPHLSTFAILLTSTTQTKCSNNQAYFWAAIGVIL